MELLDEAEAEMAAIEAAKKRLEEKRKRLREATAGMEFVRVQGGEFLMGSRTNPGGYVVRAEPVRPGPRHVPPLEWERKERNASDYSRHRLRPR